MNLMHIMHFLLLLSQQTLQLLKKQKGKTEQRSIGSVFHSPYFILDGPLNAKDIKWLDEQVHQNEEKGIDEEFPVHIQMAV